MTQINGTAAADVLEGTTLADTILGGAGDDTIWGGNYGFDLLDGGDGNDYLVADSGPNILLGGAGNDYLQGGSGDDVLNGGAGNDTLDGGYSDYDRDTADYSNITAAIKVNLNVGEEQNTLGAGTDKLISIERVLGSSGNDTLIGFTDDNSDLEGNAGNDSLVGGSADDYLFGGAGNDSLIGSTGNDTADYFGTAAVKVDLSITAAQNTLGAGTDLLSGIENVDGGLGNDTLIGTAADNNLWGDAGADSITGGAGNDTLGGGVDSVADTLVGGIGDDFYLVNSTSDVIIELAAAGTDIVESTATSYTLAANIENAHLAGGGVNLTGNTSDNIITGNIVNNTLSGADGNDQLFGAKGADTLSGGNGNDTLDGGIGTDSMAGGAGNDLYYVNSSSDIVTEALGSGSDTVNSDTTSYTLSANVENLTLLSNYYDNSSDYYGLSTSSAINGTGNELNNTITGNELDNKLVGAAGNDTLIGGYGDDTLQGGAGNDVLNGGYDTDIAIYTDAIAGVKVSLATTAAQVTGGAGTDTLISIEDLLGSAFNDTLTGSADNNYIGDGAGNDSVSAGAGDDDLYASAGNDTIDGGSGDDTFIFADATTVSKLDLSLTTAQNTLSSGTDLVTNIENIVGSSFNDSFIGNSSDNEFWGGNGNDTINGGAGNDTLDGEGGTDSLVGGIGDDTYYIAGSDVIVENASAGTDTVIADLNYTLAANIENLYLSTSINSAYAVTTTGEIPDTAYDSGSALTGTGNTSDNLIVGNYNNNTLSGLAGNDTLDGGAGADTLIGGIGNDTYVVDSSNDVVTEAASAGTDTVETSLSSYTLGANVENLTFITQSNYYSTSHTGTGNELNNLIIGSSAADTLIGNAGNDTLIGSGGIDQLTGGLGDDVYEVAYSNTWVNGSNISGFDQITEASAAGTDTVKLVAGDYDFNNTTYTLASNVENLISSISYSAKLTGNTLNNYISSSSSYSNDTIDGGAGTDTMVGGAGNDTYYVDNTGDIVTEIADTTQSTWYGDTVNSSVSFALGANIENLTLTGTSAINGIGNALSNTITGNSAANILNGGAGDDSMAGGVGNDTYYIDSSMDYITENANAGTDSVIASFATAGQSYYLGDNIENITLSGTLTATINGNSLANSITGNSAANDLSGNDGADTLIGGAGNDTLDGGSGNDRLTGDAGSDIIRLASDNTWNVSYGADTVVLNSLVGADSITGFDDIATYYGETLTTGADKLQISMAGIKVGDGDTIVENAATVSSTATSFAKGAELVIFGDTLDYSGISNATTVSTAIGSADAAYAIGDTRLFVVQTGTADYDSSAIWQFKAADADAIVESNEITLIATVDSATQLADYSFIA